MKCAHCGKRFSADWAQPAPGGSSAPGAILGFSLVGLCAAAVTFVFDIAYVPWIMLGISAFVALQIPFAVSDCRSSVGLADHGGGVCPECGGGNRVQFWSL